MADTPRFALPVIESAQAQKHVTHNEALTLLDALTQLAVESRTLVVPPERGEPAFSVKLPTDHPHPDFEQPEKTYSWWDYRMMAFRRNAGLRIDLILASTALAKKCGGCHIDKAPRKLERPSDHAPVLAAFDI